MKHDFEVKIQARLDGELSEQEARRMDEWIARDAEAGALAAELGRLKGVLSRNETAAAVPESREFYWSKIQREIQRMDRSVVAARGGWSWRRWAKPLAGLAALGCVLAIVRWETSPPAFDEISATGEGMEAITFHDQSAGMTVVWLQDSTPQVKKASDAPAAPISIPDPGESEVE